MNRNILDSIYVVTVEGRLDGIYAFREGKEADRFAGAVGDHAIVTQVPLCLTSDHTDDLIEGEIG